MDIRTAAKAAKKAAIQLAAIETALKNKALQAIVEAMWTTKEEILEANEKDLASSRKNNLAKPLLKRLKFD
ncbi:MAG: gamma-glutamyl-phosphate reductase, partial [Deltaproteobacteria bacterium]